MFRQAPVCLEPIRNHGSQFLSRPSVRSLGSPITCFAERALDVDGAALRVIPGSPQDVFELCKYVEYSTARSGQFQGRGDYVESRYVRNYQEMV